MIRSLTQHRTDLQSTLSEASSESQEDRDKNQSFKLKRRSGFQSSIQNSDHSSASNSALQSRTMMTQTKEQSTRAIIAHQSTSTSHHKSFSIHINRVSAKRHRTEISRDYTADQTARLCHETVESAERTFNAEHLVNLIQKKRLTCLVRKIIIRKSRLSHYSNQKLIISETASNLIIDRNA